MNSNDLIGDCGCHKCLEGKTEPMTGLPITAMRMVVCSICGNKRCPHATDHNLACTGSNAPGQKGSIYAGVYPLEVCIDTNSRFGAVSAKWKLSKPSYHIYRASLSFLSNRDCK
jgi:hypothetical protein